MLAEVELLCSRGLSLWAMLVGHFCVRPLSLTQIPYM